MSEVLREDWRWQAEKARNLKDVETLATCIASFPDETRLLDQLRGGEVVKLVELVPNPLSTLASLRKARCLAVPEGRAGALAVPESTERRRPAQRTQGS